MIIIFRCEEVSSTAGVELPVTRVLIRDEPHSKPSFWVAIPVISLDY